MSKLSNVHPLHRAPASIFIDVANTKARLATYYPRLEDLTDEEDQEWMDLEERLTVLQREADDEMLRLTGQPFEAWAEALS